MSLNLILSVKYLLLELWSCSDGIHEPLVYSSWQWSSHHHLLLSLFNWRVQDLMHALPLSPKDNGIPRIIQTELISETGQ